MKQLINSVVIAATMATPHCSEAEAAFKIIKHEKLSKTEAENYEATYNKEVDILARTIWGEARNQSIYGMIAVGNVIKNRLKDPKTWGKNIIAICKKPGQFSCWSKRGGNCSKMRLVTTKDQQFLQALEIAKGIIEGGYHDNTRGSVYYHEKHMRRRPSWTKFTTFTLEIGDHRFYKDG